MAALSATLAAADVSVGEELPELVIPLTTTLIVSAAIATRDYQDVHHDLGLAKERGMPNIFMNILSTNGFVGRFVTDWAGPESIVRSIAIRLGAPNFPGDTMRMSGRVTAVDATEGTVEVELRGANSMGDHVTGKVVVALPVGA
jgi:acyl dehydratase